MTPLGPEAYLLLEVDRQAETVTIMFRLDNDTEIMLGMSGDLNTLEYMGWLVSSAANFHQIPFRVKEIRPDIDPAERAQKPIFDIRVPLDDSEARTSDHFPGRGGW